jgi:hypothetical protein
MREIEQHMAAIETAREEKGPMLWLAARSHASCGEGRMVGET